MWVHNLGCETASYLDTWSSNDPGILNMVEALFKMPLPTVAAALGIDTSAAQVRTIPAPHNTCQAGCCYIGKADCGRQAMLSEACWVALQSLINQARPKIAIGPEECIAACNGTSSASSPTASSGNKLNSSGNNSAANAGLLGPQPAAQFSTLTAGPG